MDGLRLGILLLTVLLLTAVTLRAIHLRRQVKARTRALTERTKELRCVYAVSEAIIRVDSVEELLQMVVALLPSGWQYPEISRARIVFDGKAYLSPDFKVGPWSQATDLLLGRERRGTVEVFYLESRPELEDGPFLSAERDLIDAVGRLLGQAVQAKLMEGQFLVEKAHYRLLFHEMHNGFAVYKVLLDRSGRPVDYLFLDVNPAFEKMTGLKAETLIGRPVSEVMPDIEPMWIDRYGQVALSGEATFFQSYARALDRHFEVTVFQSTPGKIACIYADITRRKIYEESLASHRVRLQSLASRLANAEDLLRQEIAAGLHDSIGQDLAALKLTVDMTRQDLRADRPEGILDGISASIDGLVQKVWNLAFQLSPPGLYEAGLVPALEWLVDRFNAEHDIVFTMKIDSTLPELDKTVRGLLFQMIRELLVNTVKHAGARQVQLELAAAEDHLVATVADDGCGFDPAEIMTGHETVRGFGLFSIRERLAFVAGRLDIASGPGRGTGVTIRFPLAGTGEDTGEI